MGHCMLSNDYAHAVCWRGNVTRQTKVLLDLRDHSSTYAFAVSNDENVIIGQSCEPGRPNKWHAARWKQNPGTNTSNIEDLNVRLDPSQRLRKRNRIIYHV